MTNDRGSANGSLETIRRVALPARIEPKRQELSIAEPPNQVEPGQTIYCTPEPEPPQVGPGSVVVTGSGSVGIINIDLRTPPM